MVNAMRAMIGAILFVFGLMVFLVLWSPLMIWLLPLLENADVIWGGGEGGLLQGIVVMIPAIVVFSGIVLLISSAFEKEPQYYG